MQRQPYPSQNISWRRGPRERSCLRTLTMDPPSLGRWSQDPDRACESTGIQFNPPTMMLTLNLLSLQPSAEEVGTIIHTLPLEKGPPRGRTAFPKYNSSRPRQNSSIYSICGTRNLLQPAKFSGEMIFILYHLYSTFQTPKDSFLKHMQ